MKRSRAASSRQVLAMAAAVLAPFALPASGQAASCKPSWTGVDTSTLRSASYRDIAAHASNDVWVISDAGAGRWDGARWSNFATPLPPNGQLFAVEAIAADDVWAVGGDFDPAFARGIIEHWDGTSWSNVATPNVSGQLLDVSAVSGSDVWAVGETKASPSQLLPMIMHWDGSEWTVVPTPSPGGYSSTLFAVDARAADDVWAVGDWQEQQGQAAVGLVLHWDGTAWTVITTPRELRDVAAVAEGDVWAASPNWSGQTVHWDGTTWTTVADPFPYEGLGNIAVVGSGDLWAVGVGDRATAHWDGSQWSAVPIADKPYLYLRQVSATPDGDVWAVAETYPRVHVQRLCPARVSDTGFSPLAVGATKGGGIAWSFPATNTGAHSVTDASALGLFDSDLRAPGTSFTTTLIAAGNYGVRDTATGNTSTIKVPLSVTPTSGSTATSFTLTWASETPPAGYAVDVQIKRPGSTSYVYWQKRTTQPSGSFTPDGGPGRYSFRSRYRNLSNWSASGWSSAVTITVT